MCGRYSIATDSFSLQKQFDAELADGIKLPTYNASPSSILPVITQQAPSLIRPGKWGFVAHWGGKSDVKGLIINARQETAPEKRMFSHLTQNNRCLIPADGFFEWQKTGKAKQPFRFSLASEELFSFAGLFNVVESGEGLPEISFVIITTKPNKLVGELHDRMPIILDAKRRKQWFSLPWNDLQEVFEPFPAQQMKCYKVTPRVNSVGYNLKDAIIPWQDPNLTLF